ncbi:zinc finger CCHC domain-containing protein 9 [Pieris rapae]|uniref:zinc finger CCHC domain-containing protein 9 n=1 Tax=Pieris rapae TaxID=64459 RepID=UPI001E2809F4|nr:zinc finger CCHC domain-containing protein 9 [Pieris rapae]XP_045488357.1 zinc finger CCHC domain-containing protein 9 [Pieris rapae]
MTRFARAKGSKSSNLKDPEDSTPWEVMKEQMVKAKADNEESIKRKEAEQQRIDNYENFLKERKVEKRKVEWCDFPETVSAKVQNVNGSQNLEKKKKKRSSNVLENETSSQVSTKKVKKNKDKNKKTASENQTASDDTSPDLNNGDKNSEKNVITSNDLDKTECVENTNKKKNKKKQNCSSKSNVTQNQEVDHQSIKPSNVESRKKNKKHGDKAVRRKEITEKSFKLIINGKDVELVRFDGFPIMKKDAERLQELKNSMIKKGIPKSEVQRTIKLERRRAEKALARVKRDVCYNCRKGGHNLSDCPDLKSNIPGVESADGVCFKCGSTEHRQNECKVQRDKEFRFATCFICRETGHLARQCPDNPKGLYPNGGCCKLCGDVTHLRKDCPTVSEKKESTSIKLSTLDSTDNIEDIGQSTLTSAQETKKPKKIKF